MSQQQQMIARALTTAKVIRSRPDQHSFCRSSTDPRSDQTAADQSPYVMTSTWLDSGTATNRFTL